MSFDAGSITGDVSLDIAPLKASVAAAKAQVVDLRASTAAGLNLKFNDSFAARGNAVFESVRTPMERHGQLQRELNVLLHAGAINETTYARALRQSADAAKAASSAGASRAGGLAGFNPAALLRGGAVLGVATILGQKFEAGVNNIIRVTGEMRDGAISTSQGVYQLGTSFLEALPAAGGFVRGMKAIADELNGTNARLRESQLALEKYLEEMDAGSRRYEIIATGIKDIESAAEGAERSLMAMGRSYQVQLAKSPGDKIRVQGDFGILDAGAEIQKLEELRDALRAQTTFSTSEVGKAHLDYLSQEIDKYKTVVQNFEGWIGVQADEADFKPIADLQKQVRQFDMTPLQKQFDDLRETMDGSPVLLDRAKVVIDELRGKQVGGIFADLQSQLAALDMTPLEAKFDEFRRTNKILDPDELAKAKQMMDEIDVKSKVKDALESIRSPMDKYEETLGQLREWRDAGRITSEQFGTLNAKARKDAFGDTKLPGLIRSGSAESQALSYDRERGGRSGQEALPQQQVAQQKISNQKLDLIARYLQQQLQNGGPIEFVGF